MGHLGLGDHAVTNAIVRQFARDWERVLVLTRFHNAPSVQFMFRDLSNVEVRTHASEEESKAWAGQFARDGGEVFQFSIRESDLKRSNWDQLMYRQAGVDFTRKWLGFHVERDRTQEVKPPDWPYAFVHEVSSNGTAIGNRLRVGCQKTVVASPVGHIFQWWRVIERAQEIHCIDSCFANFIDLIPDDQLKADRFFCYAKTGQPIPTLKPKWTIVQ